MTEQAGQLDRGDGVMLAWRRLPGRSPTVVFLPGFGSDMAGSKAGALADWCGARGQAFLRLDYSGHGASGGRFAEGTIGRWRDDALAVIDAASAGPLALVGSSMGGWMALLVALARRDRVLALIGVAAAPDFTERLIWQATAAAEQRLRTARGWIELPYAHGPPQILTMAFIEDGRRHLLLDGPIALDIPVRLLHGQRDAEVPWETATCLAARLGGDDVQVLLVKDGDHRLSRAVDLALLVRTLGPLLGGEDGA